MFKYIRFVMVVLCGFVMFTSCQKEEAEEMQVAPQLPPVETLIMPFQGFEDADTTGLIEGGTQYRSGGTYRNWFFAATNLVAWNTGVIVHSAVPIAAFVEAFKYDAKFQGNGVWLWSYTADVAGETYEVGLTGAFISNTEIEWNMRLSQVGGFQNVLWLTGVTSTNDDGGGEWTLYGDVNNTHQPYLNVSYGENTPDVGFIRYENVISGDPDEGGYIEYREDRTGTATYDRAYDVFQIQEDNLLEIQWNEEEGFGRVRNLKHFGDNDWNCWDVNFMDVDC